MTTTVKVQVNGKYRAHVKMTPADGDVVETIVEGNYEGSNNPAGEMAFSLPHPADAVFKISEEPVEE